MTYNATYTADDVAPVVIDTGTKVLVTAGAFAAIFALLLAGLLIAWLIHKTK